MAPPPSSERAHSKVEKFLADPMLAATSSLRIIDPLEVKFSQQVVYPSFRNGTGFKVVLDTMKETEIDFERLNESASVASSMTRAIKLSASSVSITAPKNKKIKEALDSAKCLRILKHKFPPIRVVLHKPKLRDKVGKPLLDKSGEQLYGPEEYYTLDNRRLFCLQRKAVVKNHLVKKPSKRQIHPSEQKVLVVCEILDMNARAKATELSKFRTRTNGETIEIGYFLGRGRANVQRVDNATGDKDGKTGESVGRHNFLWDYRQAIEFCESALLSERFDEASLDRCADKDCGVWEYILPSSLNRSSSDVANIVEPTTFGPFSNVQMQLWCSTSSLPPSLPTRRRIHDSLLESVLLQGVVDVYKCRFVSDGTQLSATCDAALFRNIYLAMMKSFQEKGATIGEPRVEAAHQDFDDNSYGTSSRKAILAKIGVTLTEKETVAARSDENDDDDENENENTQPPPIDHDYLPESFVRTEIQRIITALKSAGSANGDALPNSEFTLGVHSRQELDFLNTLRDFLTLKATFFPLSTCGNFESRLSFDDPLIVEFGFD